VKEANLAKIAIKENADALLEASLKTLGADNTTGKITKTDLASWAILNSLSSLDNQTIEIIRKAHFNQVIYLENLLRKLKQSGREALSSEEISQLNATTKKALKKSKPLSQNESE
jgi:hypothetical protein